MTLWGKDNREVALDILRLRYHRRGARPQHYADYALTDTMAGRVQLQQLLGEVWPRAWLSANATLARSADARRRPRTTSCAARSNGTVSLG